MLPLSVINDLINVTNLNIKADLTITFKKHAFMIKINQLEIKVSTMLFDTLG